MPTLSTAELVLRVALAVALGGALGIERELSDQPAGFRTHILVSLGAALFTLAGAYGVESFVTDSTIRVQLDPTRIAAQVVTGIGFLGAGAILRRGVNVRGLTTAAGLWVTAAIGVAVGLGYYEGAVAVTGFALAALYGFKLVEKKLLTTLRRGQVRFLIEAREGFDLAQLRAALESAGASVVTLRAYDDEGEGWHVVVIARVPRQSSANEIADRLTAIENVDTVEIDI